MDFAGKHCEGREIGEKIHIALCNACKAFKGRTIEPFAMCNTISELLNRDGHTLCHPYNVSELQIYEANALLLNSGHDLLMASLMFSLCHATCSSARNSW